VAAVVVLHRLAGEPHVLGREGGAPQNRLQKAEIQKLLAAGRPDGGVDRADGDDEEERGGEHREPPPEPAVLDLGVEPGVRECGEGKQDREAERDGAGAEPHATDPVHRREQYDERGREGEGGAPALEPGEQHRRDREPRDRECGVQRPPKDHRAVLHVRVRSTDG